MAKHLSYEDLLAAASEPNEHGTRFLTVELESGDTAWAPGTTKYVLQAFGSGSVEYRFFREGVEGFVTGPVGRRLI